MASRQIEPCEINGRIVYIEVTEVDVGRSQVRPSESEQPLPDYLEPTAVKDKVVNAGEAIRDIIAALADAVHQGLSSLSPEEWTLEITLGFKGKAGIPFVTEGEANGAVKVSAKWKP